MRKISLIGVAMAALACVSALASAAQARSSRNRYNPYDQPPAYSYSSGEACQKMCPQDLSPCDPINFKLADSRCASIFTR
jgi:hypothetical protein